jgi:hypothetical protein
VQVGKALSVLEVEALAAVLAVAQAVTLALAVQALAVLEPVEAAGA